MSEVSTIGLDLAKNVFQAHGASSAGASSSVGSCGATRCWLSLPPNRRVWWQWRRARVPTIGSGDREARPHRAAGRTRLCEAFRQTAEERHVRRGGDLRSGAAPDHALRGCEERSQAGLRRDLPTRDILVGQRTQLINAIRVHLSEYGLIAPQGPFHVGRLIAQIEDPTSSVPEAARSCLASSPRDCAICRTKSPRWLRRSLPAPKPTTRLGV